MGKGQLPCRAALASYRRAARVLHSKSAQAHSGEELHQGWTQLKASNLSPASKASSPWPTSNPSPASKAANASHPAHVSAASHAFNASEASNVSHPFHHASALSMRPLRIPPFKSGPAVASVSWKPRFGRICWEDSLRLPSRERRVAKRSLSTRTVSTGQPSVWYQSCVMSPSDDALALSFPSTIDTMTDTESDSDSDSAATKTDATVDNGNHKLAHQSVALPTNPGHYVGQRIARCSINAQGQAVAGAVATVVGYLSATETGFVSAKTRLPAPLWRIKFHDDALGEEEVEVDQVADGYLAYRGLSSHNILYRDSVEAARPDTTGGWQVTGSSLIGRFVRRGVRDRHSVQASAHSLAGYVDGTIRAWLPPEASNYFGKSQSKPQPLFRVVYHRSEIGIEDLDLEEATHAIAQYSCFPVEMGSKQDEWLCYGNSYIGKRIRRSVFAGSSMQAVDGMVRGWLPAEISNFWSEHSNRPAALWRVVYDNLAIGQEDLEDFEVEEAVQVYQLEVVRTTNAAAAGESCSLVALPCSVPSR